ncbi:class I SAM-dependent methyltransferase [bacterium]|nr:class I SAM-dependent methyltransferase [bacterium]
MLSGETRSCETRTLRSIFDRSISEDLKIIEAGCGLGGWVSYFRRKGYDIIGIEYDQREIQKTLSYDKDLPVYYGHVNHLEYPDDAFDIYISLSVIEHFHECPQKALLETKRILKNNGLAFITVSYLSLFRGMITQPLRNLYFF